MIIVRRFPQGPRVWVLDQRIHHGATGALLALAGRHHRTCIVAGLLLCAHDRRDWRAWFRRESAGMPLDS